MCGQDQDLLPSEDNHHFPLQPQASTPFPWHIGVFDAHCHLAERRLSLANLPSSKLRSLVVMATRLHDQDIVASMASEPFLLSSQKDLRLLHKKTVIPAFGCHPWFSHQLYDDTAPEPTFDPVCEDVRKAKTKHYSSVLTPPPADDNTAFINEQPTPVPLSTFIAQTRHRLQSHPHAMVGEIGLDKPFRLPEAWDPVQKIQRHDPERPPGARMGRPLSRHHITTEHQRVVLAAQLKLAGEMNRPVSVHGVQAHGVLFEILAKCWEGHPKRSKRALARKAKADNGQRSGATPALRPYPPRICLHSYTAHPTAVKQYVSAPPEFYFSFSKTNNLRDAASREKTLESIKEVPDDRVLVESDLHSVGERMDGEVEEMYRVVCEVKGWRLEEGVRRIGENFERFVLGEDRRSA